MALCEAAVCGSSLLWPRVLLFGDSITQFSFQQGGWGASLADRLVRKCDVLNRGFSGYNTRWAKIILPRLIRKGNSLDSPVAVTIFFGANDSALKGENPKQHVPLEEYAANLTAMVRYLQSVDVPESRLIFITPPPLCEAAWGQECLGQGLFFLFVRRTTFITKRKCVFVLPSLAFDREESLFPAFAAPLLARHSRSKTGTESSGRWGRPVTENQVQLLIYRTGSRQCTKTPR
ncbi:isoamyl acetate-hydrolyzing esterase 1 homolog isoform X2 [Mesoplodon densirostris]|uniref:isoamyl acetate-hydrolyzing esterase 1 homolog isoform X2 n=1 Tax=Mesoplodon densirostris TaxID=48708 RepID=UPI0028DC56A6|nr:isoamyl acetate-hydrolyzing esterase 1 homolog isoform X2 [Mesoplodon densirostris]